MSSGKLHNRNFHEDISEVHFDISEIVIPFSRVFGKYNTSDIYSGSEKIPFKERNPEYKMILRQEFLNCMNLH